LRDGVGDAPRSTNVLMLAGLAAIGFMMRRRRRS
jgi:MYXO-CTERM domain-containing protein